MPDTSLLVASIASAGVVLSAGIQAVTNLGGKRREDMARRDGRAQEGARRADERDEAARIRAEDAAAQRERETATATARSLAERKEAVSAFSRLAEAFLFTLEARDAQDTAISVKLSQ